MSWSQEAVGVQNLPGFQTESKLSVPGMWGAGRSGSDAASCVVVTVSFLIVSVKQQGLVALGEF